MLLYDSAVSGNCYKVRLLLHQLGLPFERRELSVFDRSDRLEVLGGRNPALRVPTLVLDDGRTLGESNAILWYFGEDTPYVPTDAFQRAQVLQWQFFEQYDHEPNIAVARFWQLADMHLPEADVAAKRAGGERALAAMERHLAEHDFLVGDGYTIADISLYAYTHIAPEAGLSLTPYPAIREWLTRVAAQPGHVAITD
ncbi:MAG TPA: glutathione S-transferase family protein [Solirubrobacteraceae bacterium]|jgi:glutathione S-transferase|nr:glutathione S-transferase family protein [Solirubrobacteraceae bacterium]